MYSMSSRPRVASCGSPRDYVIGSTFCLRIGGHTGTDISTRKQRIIRQQRSAAAACDRTVQDIQPGCPDALQALLRQFDCKHRMMVPRSGRGNTRGERPRKVVRARHCSRQEGNWLSAVTRTAASPLSPRSRIVERMIRRVTRHLPITEAGNAIALQMMASLVGHSAWQQCPITGTGGLGLPDRHRQSL